MNKSRTYSSPLREQQQEETRQRIVLAALEEISENPRGEFSQEQVARRAGIALRTVYRHFPVRTELMDAVWQESDRRIHLSEYPDTEEKLLADVRGIFNSMDDNAGLIHGLIRSEAGLEMRRRDNDRRRRGVMSALADATSHMDDGRKRLVVAIFQGLYSARMWEMLRERGQLTKGEPSEAIRWAMDTLLAGLRREQKAAARVLLSGKQARRKTATTGNTRSKNK